MLDKFTHSINIDGTLHLMSRNVDFRNFILRLSYYKDNFQPQKFICQYRNLFVRITLSMVFIKHNSLKPDIFFNPIFMSCFSGSMFFSVHVFQDPCYSGSIFFKVQAFAESMFFWVQLFQGPALSGFVSRVWVQVLEVAHSFILYAAKEFYSCLALTSFIYFSKMKM